MTKSFSYLERIRKYKNTKTQGYKDTKVRKYENTKIRVYENTRIRAFPAKKIRKVFVLRKKFVVFFTKKIRKGYEFFQPIQE